MRKLFSVFAILAFAAAIVTVVSAAEDGKALYDSKCAMCHGKDGVAKPMAKGSRNFNDAAFQKEATVASITKIVEDGKAEPGKGKMPASKGKLTDEQIKAIAEYVKTIK
jgi:cytochrome c6